MAVVEIRPSEFWSDCKRYN